VKEGSHFGDPPHNAWGGSAGGQKGRLKSRGGTVRPYEKKVGEKKAKDGEETEKNGPEMRVLLTSIKGSTF